jgi:hypothetical protein
VRAPLPSRWPRVRSLRLSIDVLTVSAGAQFADTLLRAAFGGEKGLVAPSYVFLGAEAGGAAVQKEIGADLAYFSARIELGVSGWLRRVR